jgi:hypothetical protein
MNIHLIMMAVLNDDNNTDPQQGLFNVWDYLEEQGFPTHYISQYMEENGEMLTNKALLAKMVDL